MKRLLLVAALCLLAVTSVSADAQGSMTFWAKYVTSSGDTHGLDGGYVMYATTNGYTGLSPWQFCWIGEGGYCRVDLPLPILCWSGTNICTTLNGQWLYWTVVPPHFGECTPMDGPAQGVTWIATQAERIGTVWQGECAR